MSDNTTVWLKPAQIDEMRKACYSDSVQTTVQARNDAILAVMYDSGLRPAEVCGLTTEMFHADEGVLRLPSSVQKDHPNDTSPPPATIELEQDEWTRGTVSTLRQYLSGRWKDSMYLFPSLKRESMTTRSLRNVIKSTAIEASVQPHVGFGERGDPSDVHPHALRHSLAYRLLCAREDGTTLNDLKKRLRHRSIHTTEKHYEHFDSV